MDKHSMYSFHLLLFLDDGTISELWLPSATEGVFRFSEKSGCSFLSFVAKDNCWYAVCSSPAFFQNVPIDSFSEMSIADNELLHIDFEGREFVLFAENVSVSQLQMINYFVNSETDIVIGTDDYCDICYKNPLLSSKAFELRRENSRWILEARNNAIYGPYVNGIKQLSCVLKTGDNVCLLGLKIIIGINYLSVNGNNENIKLGHKLQQNTSSLFGPLPYYSHSNSDFSEVYFNRSPRKHFGWEPQVVDIEGPPMSTTNKQIPLMLRMGSSIVMGGSAALAGNYMSLITSVLFPMLTSKYSDKQRQEYEKLRKEKYTEYLEKKQIEISDKISEESKALNEKYPSPEEFADNTYLKHLWERRPVDNDFLHIKLGMGNKFATTVINYPDKRFSLDSDELEDKMYQLVEQKYLLKNVPIIMPLVDTLVCGITGQRNRVLEYINQIILQLAFYHSYDEVKMVFLIDETELKHIDYVRFMPHVWDDQRLVRYIATDEAEAYFIGEKIKTYLERDGEKDVPLNKILKQHPYYVIFALNKKLIDGHEVFKQFLQAEKNIGGSVIIASEDLPKETGRIITLKTENENTYTTLNSDGSEEESFSICPTDRQKVSQLMQVILNTRLKSIDRTLSLPKKLTFLEMFKVGRIEQLNPLKRWAENNPIKSLAAPVGVAEDGSLFMLDLHEKRQGPHGLVAGMTGSGKSEFLITYILSMAINYHPNEVAFVLIDYKGGGLVDAFENSRTGVRLPHLAGTITNLDGSSIQRSLMSIESELIRRQKVFSETSKKFDEGAMNIYTYQQMFRDGKVSEPMPHLFIISDEFAELKQQQPEFMDKLISAARIGRSLGVHLILATQKPSGVVNDQIRSNTKFRVCLRVQERSDSMDMLKRPEAAELTDTGRFYLQVGYNEYFALGQSAWCGAQYEPQEFVPVQRDDVIEFLDITGQVTAKAKQSVKKKDSGLKQIVAVVQYLATLAEREKVSVHNLWKEPLDTYFPLSRIREIYGEEKKDFINVLMGVVDEPTHQTQSPLYIDVQHLRNLLVVGDTGSGKTSFLRNLLFELTVQYTSEQVQYYIFDFSSRNLKQFEKASHCGGFITDDDENQIRQGFSLIQKIVEERKTKFAVAEVSSFDAYIQIEKLPIIVIVIDDIVRIEEMKARSEFYSCLEILFSNGVSYGIKFVYTVSQINTCPMRLRRNSGGKIALHAKDLYAYSDILEKKCFYAPIEKPGRGMCVIDECCYEFQLALPVDSENEAERSKLISHIIKESSEKTENATVARRLNTNEELSYEEFCRKFENERIPLGRQFEIDKEIAIPLQQLKNIAVYFGNKKGIAPVISNLLYAFERENASVFIIKRNDDSVFDSTEVSVSETAKIFTSSFSCISDVLQYLKGLVQERKQYRDEYCAENGIANHTDDDAIRLWRRYVREKTTPLFVLIESLTDIALALDLEISAMLSGFFRLSYKFNIYFVICTHPDDYEVIYREKFPNGEENANQDESSAEYIRRRDLRHIWDELNKACNPDKFCLLFGGHYDSQHIADLPVQLQNTKKVCNLAEINKFVMQYRQQFYYMVMPCEKIQETEDDDEQSIV